MTKKRVLVIGAGSAIGKRVVTALANSAWAIPVAATAAMQALTDHAGIDWLPVNEQNTESLTAALSNVDLVVNASAGQAENINSTAHALFDAAQSRANVGRIVHISSMTVYGSAVGNVDESSPLLGDVSPYAAAHVAAENLAVKHPGTVILRPGCEYGPGCDAWSGRVAQWLCAGRIGDLGPMGDGYCNLVFIDDVVSAVINALQLPGIEGQAFNLAMSSPPTWNEYFIQYAKALGAVPVRRITSRRLRLEARLFAIPLKLAEVLMRKMPLSWRAPAPIPPSLIRLCNQEIKLNSHKSEHGLRMHWTTLSTGLQAAADFYRGVR